MQVTREDTYIDNQSHTKENIQELYQTSKNYFGNPRLA